MCVDDIEAVVGEVERYASPTANGTLRRPRSAALARAAASTPRPDRCRPSVPGATRSARSAVIVPGRTRRPAASFRARGTAAGTPPSSRRSATDATAARSRGGRGCRRHRSHPRSHPESSASPRRRREAGSGVGFERSWSRHTPDIEHPEVPVAKSGPPARGRRRARRLGQRRRRPAELLGRDWVATAAGLARPPPRRGDRRRAVRHQHHLPARAPGSARARCGPTPTTPAATTSTSAWTSSTGWTWSTPGTRTARTARSDRSHRNIDAKVTDVLNGRRLPGGHRRRPLDHLPVGDRGGPEVRLGQGSGCCTSTRTPTPPTASRATCVSHGTPMRRLIESGAVRGRNFVQVRTARLLAAAGRVRLDARAGDDLAPHARGVGPRHASGHRRRDRPGRRRLRRALPVGRHRRAGPGFRARAPAPRSPAG